MKNISPKMIFVPMFITMAMHIVNIRRNGSNHESVIRNRIARIKGMAIMKIVVTSLASVPFEKVEET